MIQFQNVSKRYKDNEFHINELDFRIDPGEFVFMIGPSGSGKTTVIKLLIREELPTEGRIFFDDFDITRLSRNSVYKLRRQIGVVFQDYKLIPDKTVYENVAFAMEVAGKNDTEIKETVPYLLDIVGLSHRTTSFPDHLSGGEKQRVAIARAVANNPRVLIADEPTGNLDPGAAWDIVQILSKINNWGTTVIMSTHGTDIVNTLNKRVIQMSGGRVVRDDNKGFYEITKPGETETATTESGLIIPAVEEEAARKGPIKVSLRKPEAEKAATGFLGLFQRRKSVLQSPKQELHPATQIFGNDLGAGEEVSAVEDVVESAESTSVDELNIPEQVKADLVAAGYTTIEHIIEAGPDVLGEELTIDPDSLVQIAKAVAEFATARGVTDEVVSEALEQEAAAETAEPVQKKAKPVARKKPGQPKSKAQAPKAEAEEETTTADSEETADKAEAPVQSKKQKPNVKLDLTSTKLKKNHA